MCSNPNYSHLNETNEFSLDSLLKSIMSNDEGKYDKTLSNVVKSGAFTDNSFDTNRIKQEIDECDKRDHKIEQWRNSSLNKGLRDTLISRLKEQRN